MLSWTNGSAVAWRSEEVDTGCHFYRWALQRLLPQVGQHNRQGHPCCSVVSEIPLQTHSCSQLAWWKWSVSPSDAVSCPQRAQTRQKTVGSLPILCLEHEVLGTGHWAQGTHYRCPENNPNSCPVDVAVAQGFRGSLWAACQRLAGGRHCSPLCTAVIPPIKIPSVLRLFNRAAHRQITHQCCLLCCFPLWCGHSCTLVSVTAQPLSLWFFSPSAIESWTFAYLTWGLFSEAYLCWNTSFLLSSLIYIALLWERLGQSCVALCYFSAVLVAVPWFFWMGQEKVVAGLTNSKYLILFCCPSWGLNHRENDQCHVSAKTHSHILFH